MSTGTDTRRTPAKTSLLGRALALYERLFAHVAAVRLEQRDLDPRLIHAHLAAVLSTSILMWAYAFLAQASMSHWAPGAVGLTASLVHLLSPLLFRFTNRAHLVCAAMLAPGLAHQATFSWFTGGFSSSTILWFAIHPLLGGVLVGRAGVAVWSLIVSVLAAVLLALQLAGYAFPQAMDAAPAFAAHALTVFGWIFLAAVMTSVHLTLQARHADELAARNRNINHLLRVVSHDIVSPAASIKLLLRALPTVDAELREKHVAMMGRACDAMVNMCSSVRRVQDTAHISGALQRHRLDESAAFLAATLAPRLSEKRQRFAFDAQALRAIVVLVDPPVFNHQVLANLLVNSIKFSPPEATIELSARQCDDLVEICIRDRGIGMSPSLASALLDDGEQGSRAGTLGERGHGLGFLIVRTVVTELGGSVRVESRAQTSDAREHGTTVTLTLPAAG